MPSTVNGIGTWYYGKANVHRIKSTCEFCHRVTDLTSYDTTLYFVILYIPVIPLGKKRILNECAVCHQHRYLSGSEWEKQKNTAMTATLAKLAESPNDPEALADALGAATTFQDAALFERISEFAKAETENPKLQTMLGEALGYFGRRQEADTAFAHAIRNQPEPEVYKSAAMNALRMGEPDRAAELLDYVTRDKVKDDFGYVQVVIDTYQATGKHSDALALMDKRDEAFPELATERDLIKARQQSEKYQGTNKRLNTINLIENEKHTSTSGAGAGSLVAKLIFPIILLAAFIAYLGFAFYYGNNGEVHIVNGTPKAYTATVNGQSVTVPAFQAKVVSVPEGEINVAAEPFEPVTAELKTNFWTRPFSRPLFLINPDRTAVIVEEQTTYSSNPPINPEPKYHFAKPTYSLKRPDFVFEAFPPTMKMKKNASIVKHRVGLEFGLTPIQYVSLATNPKFGLPKDSPFLLNLANAFPDEPLYLQIAVGMNPEISDSFLKKGLAVRPLRMEWHRAYQTMTERLRPEHDLVAEYTAINNEVKSADSKYLLARAMRDGDESRNLMNEAANSSPPSEYARYSLSFRAHVMGEYNEAVKWAKMCFESDPKQSSFRDRYLESLWANADYQTFREVAAQSSFGIRRSGEIDQFRAALMEKNLSLADQIKTTASRKADPQYQSRLFDEFELSKAMIDGQVNRYLTLTNKGPNENQMDDRDMIVIRALLNDQPDAAAVGLTVTSGPGRDTIMPGLISLAYRKAKNAKKADDWAKRMLEALKKEGRSERQLAVMLNGEKPFDFEQVKLSLVLPEEKRVVLYVAAEILPEHAEKLNAFAKKLDVQKDRVSLVLSHLGKR